MINEQILIQFLSFEIINVCVKSHSHSILLEGWIYLLIFAADYFWSLLPNTSLECSNRLLIHLFTKSLDRGKDLCYKKQVFVQITKLISSNDSWFLDNMRLILLFTHRLLGLFVLILLLLTGFQDLFFILLKMHAVVFTSSSFLKHHNLTESHDWVLRSLVVFK